MVCGSGRYYDDWTTFWTPYGFPWKLEQDKDVFHVLTGTKLKCILKRHFIKMIWTPPSIKVSSFDFTKKGPDT